MSEDALLIPRSEEQVERGEWENGDSPVEVESGARVVSELYDGYTYVRLARAHCELVHNVCQEPINKQNNLCQKTMKKNQENINFEALL